MADLWVEFQARMKVTSDSDAELVEWNRDRNLALTQQTDLMSISGHYDLTSGQSNITIPMGDLTTGYFLYLESDNNLASFNLDGDDFNIPLRQRMGTNNAVAMLMTEFTSIRVNAGAGAARITFLIVGA